MSSRDELLSLKAYDDAVCKKTMPIGTWRRPIPASDRSLPQFLVGPENGFLPREDPLIQLPNRFQALEELLQEMPILRRDGSPGLLASGDFGEAVERRLPLYGVDDVEDTRLLAALYRDYTFVASAYLLEPCDLKYRREKQYGFGRDRLPRSIAVPLTKLAQKIGAKPFMEYALSYALYNWKRLDPSRPLEYDNVDLIRSFAGAPSERGFILVHVAMVRYSGELVRGVLDTLDGAEHGDRGRFDDGLRSLFGTMMKINQAMETMWNRSKPSEYEHFRTFIMGTKNQPMFPNGVVYQGVSDEPQFYRGESGANDSMIPTMDNLLQLTERLPENPLTAILKDFRTYRPANHSEWVQWVQDEAARVGIRRFAEQDPVSAVWYLKNVDLVRNFRTRHWNFTKEYILRFSDHPVATGGSPIVTWLPNQLRAVLQLMHDVAIHVEEKKLEADLAGDLEEMRKRVAKQIEVLDGEVMELRNRFPDQERLATV